MDRLVLALCAMMCLWLICDSRVKTGLSGTLGLLLIACGCMAGLDSEVILRRAFLLIAWGGLLIGWGVFWRVNALHAVRALANNWPWVHSVLYVLGIDRRESWRIRS